MESIKKLIPFSLEKALKGEPVVTRDFIPVSQLTKFHVDDESKEYCLAGIMAGGDDPGLGTWMIDGQWNMNRYQSAQDLFHVEHCKRVWVLVWISANGGVCVTQKPYESYDLADIACSELKKTRPDTDLEVHINEFLVKI